MSVSVLLTFAKGVANLTVTNTGNGKAGRGYRAWNGTIHPKSGQANREFFTSFGL
jgi:hypothetical protein